MTVLCRVVLPGPEQVNVEPLEVREPEPGWVCVRTTRAGICGSDLHAYRRGHPFRPYPLRPGHEASGVVTAVGDGVADLSRGDPVYLMPEMPCGHCAYCRGSRPNLCTAPGGVGGSVPGAMANEFHAPRECVRAVPSGMSLRAASLIEPLAAAIHAVKRAGSLAGRPVVVIGGGTIGLLVLLASRSAGAVTVVVSDPVRAKRDAALALDASASVDPSTSSSEDAIRAAAGDPPYAVFDCVGAAESLTLAVELAMLGGTVIVVGAPHGDLRLPIERMHHGEVTITGAVLYGEADFLAAERLILGGAPVERLITAEYGLAQAELAFDAALGGQEIKVQFVPDGVTSSTKERLL